METFNFVSLPILLVLGLAGAPVWFRRVGYPWGKTVLGSLTVLVAMLAVWGILSNIQNHLGLTALPLGWLVPLAAIAAGWHWRDRHG